MPEMDYVEDSFRDTGSEDSDIDTGTTVVIINGKKQVIPAGGSTIVNIPGMRNLRIGDGQINVVTRPTHRSHHKSQSPKRDTSGQKHHSSELTDSESAPTRSDLNYVCDNIGKKWKKLGTVLGLSRGQIESIEVDYHIEGNYEMAYQMLLKWKRQNGDLVTVRDLAHALDGIGFSELARELPLK